MRPSSWCFSVVIAVLLQSSATAQFNRLSFRNAAVLRNTMLGNAFEGESLTAEQQARLKSRGTIDPKALLENEAAVPNFDVRRNRFADQEAKDIAEQIFERPRKRLAGNHEFLRSVVFADSRNSEVLMLVQLRTQGESFIVHNIEIVVPFKHNDSLKSVRELLKPWATKLAAMADDDVAVQQLMLEAALFSEHRRFNRNMKCDRLLFRTSRGFVPNAHGISLREVFNGTPLPHVKFVAPDYNDFVAGRLD